MSSRDPDADAKIRPRRDHLSLGPELYDPVRPARFPRHDLRFRNDRWAARVGLAGLSDEAWVDRFARFEPLEGSLPEPIALRYHGHQFHHYNPDLGDGRGFLYAQLTDLDDGRLLDLGTKGSGRTPYARGGDGRLTLKGGVRELLATEMLEAQGVYTSKTFSLVETGESLERHDEPSPTRACVLVRLSHGHLRFGTAQRLFALGQHDALARLLAHTRRLYLPHAADDRAGLFAAIAHAQARLAASWMAAGFVHGVLNTDNLGFTGESFDYGPWRFLPTHDPRFVAAYFDRTGLYAFGRQPMQVLWSLHRLAEALEPLIPRSATAPVLRRWPHDFSRALHRAVEARLGVEGAPPALVGALFLMLRDTGAGFEQTFADWYGTDEARAAQSPQRERYRGPRFAEFRRLLGQAQRAHPWDGPAGPCETMLIDEVEEIWQAIDKRDEWGPLRRKVERLRSAARPSPMFPPEHRPLPPHDATPAA